MSETGQLMGQLTTLQGELKGYVSRTHAKMDNMQRQLDSLDSAAAYRHSSYSGKSLEDVLKANESVQRLLRDRKGTAIVRLEGADARLFETKTTITETATGAGLAAVGTATTGVLPIDRILGIVPEARYALRLRNVLYSRPTTAAVIDFVRVSSAPTIASPVVEASTKPENAATFTASSERVRTLATWLPATRQVLDDFQELRGYIDGALAYAVNKDEEIEMLAGDGTGEHLHGILPQATSFNTALLSASAGYTRLDIVAEAIAQIAAAAEVEPSFIVLNTADWWKLRLTKDSYGRYILGDPQAATILPQIWGVNVVPTNSIATGTFLVGNGSSAAIEVVDRMETIVEISTEHSDFFTRNMVAIRAEKRLALIVKRPAAFVTGSLTTSPVS